jgi:hypothetical protein
LFSHVWPATFCAGAGDAEAAAAHEQQPKAKRRISRLQHMSVHKAAQSPGKDQAELPHKASPAAKAGFSFPASLARDEGMEDQADDEADDITTAPHSQQQPQQEQLEEPSFSPAAKVVGLRSVAQPTPQAGSSPADEDDLMSEPPAMTAAVAASQPAGTSATAADAEEVTPGEAAAAAATEPKQQQPPAHLQDINLDDDDDDWEDQPAPYITTAEDSAAQGDAAAAGAEQSDVLPYDPTSRRRVQYDDEDEWEELMAQEKKGKQAGVAQQVVVGWNSAAALLADACWQMPAGITGCCCALRLCALSYVPFVQVASLATLSTQPGSVSCSGTRSAHMAMLDCSFLFSFFCFSPTTLPVMQAARSLLVASQRQVESSRKTRHSRTPHQGVAA